MRYYLPVLCSLMLFTILCCTTQSQIKVRYEIAKGFRMDIFDSLHIGSDNIEKMLSTNEAVVVYIGNNECSECIADLNEFNEHYQAADIKKPCIYIMTGTDTLLVDYYLKEEKIKFNDNSTMVYDTTFYFNDLMPQYTPNQIFILKKDSLVKRISELDTNDEEAWDSLFSMFKNCL